MDETNDDDEKDKEKGIQRWKKVDGSKKQTDEGKDKNKEMKKGKEKGNDDNDGEDEEKETKTKEEGRNEWTKETKAKWWQKRIMTTMTEKMRRETVRRVEGRRTKRTDGEEDGGRRQRLRSRIPGTADEPEVVSAPLSSFAKYRRRFLASHVYVHRLPRTS
ncbi:hypothetical protein WN51_13938 [Melipona quadrifasciata]|uniref:Uncharacterized protein n=1 Tax=Melipona quadrifasciata TaxID=166423 RepID=A0A0M8ZYS5_9HYME|nr:hypothetical protein WN51_13938 [Melipona quadrifasciata]